MLIKVLVVDLDTDLDWLVEFGGWASFVPISLAWVTGLMTNCSTGPVCDGWCDGINRGKYGSSMLLSSGSCSRFIKESLKNFEGVM